MFGHHGVNEPPMKQCDFEVRESERRKRSNLPFLLCQTLQYQFVKCVSVCIICVRCTNKRREKNCEETKDDGNGFAICEL